MESKRLLFGFLIIAAIAFVGFLSVPYLFPETKYTEQPANAYDLAYSSTVKAAENVCSFQSSTGNFVAGQVIMYDRVKSAADSTLSTFRCYPGLTEYASCGLKSAEVLRDFGGAFVSMCNPSMECAITFVPGDYNRAMYENLQKPSGC